MRLESWLLLLASSQQYWLHPESQRTRGFNTELRCSSSEGITRAVLREIDPQHIQSQGCPSRAHLQRTNTLTQTPGHNLFMSFTHKHTAHCLFTHTHALTQKQQHTIHEAVMTPHSLYCPTMHSAIIWSSIPCYQPSRTTITISHSTTGKTWSPACSDVHKYDQCVLFTRLRRWLVAFCGVFFLCHC